MISVIFSCNSRAHLRAACPWRKNAGPSTHQEEERPVFAQGANAIGNDASQWRLLFEQTQVKLKRHESLLKNALEELAHLKGINSPAPQAPAPPPLAPNTEETPAAEEAPATENTVLIDL